MAGVDHQRTAAMLLYCMQGHRACSFVMESVGAGPNIMLYPQTKGVKRGLSTVYSALTIRKTIKTRYTFCHCKGSNNVCDSFTLPVLFSSRMASVSYYIFLSRLASVSLAL